MGAKQNTGCTQRFSRGKKILWNTNTKIAIKADLKRSLITTGICIAKRLSRWLAVPTENAARTGKLYVAQQICISRHLPPEEAARYIEILWRRSVPAAGNYVCLTISRRCYFMLQAPASCETLHWPSGRVEETSCHKFCSGGRADGLSVPKLGDVVHRAAPSFGKYSEVCDWHPAGKWRGVLLHFKPFPACTGWKNLNLLHSRMADRSVRCNSTCKWKVLHYRVGQN